MDKYLQHWKIVRGCVKEIVHFGVTMVGRLSVNRRLFNSLSLSCRGGYCQRPCNESCVSLTLLGEVERICVQPPEKL